MGQFKAGQAVREIRTGRYGITTDAQRARTPQIPVMFLGASYPVLMQIDQIEHDNKED